MKSFSKTVTYRWTTLDASAAVLSHLIDIWATPYRLRPRDLEGGRHKLRAGIPLLDKDGFQFGHDGLIQPGTLVSVPLGATLDPPSVARFFRPGYEWVDLPPAVDVKEKSIREVLEACFEHDKIRFAHFDPKVVYTSYASSAAANWPEMMPNSPFKIPGTLMNPYNYPWGDLAMLHFEYWENTEWRAALIDSIAPTPPGFSWTAVGNGLLEGAKGLGSSMLWILGADPWTGVWTEWPWDLPADKGNHCLKKVLAREPLGGVPIQALPSATTSEPNSRCVSVVSIPAPRIELDGFGRQIIKPLRDPARTLSGPFSRRLRACKIRFRITIPFPATTTRIEVYQGDSLYYREVHQLGEWLLPGTHIWTWDGYDKDGVFDTTALKAGNLSVRLSVVDAKGRCSSSTMTLATAADKYRWADTRIDTQNRRIDVTVFHQFLSPSEMTFFDLRLPIDNLSNVLDSGMEWLADKAGPRGGAAMMGMLPSLLEAWPEQAGTSFDKALKDFRTLFQTEGHHSDPDEGTLAVDKYKGLLPGMLNTGEVEVGSSLGSIWSGSDLDPATFEKMRSAVIEGIRRHWSRKVQIEDDEWDVQVSCQERATDATRVYLASDQGLLGDLRGEEADRSFNLNIVEGLPTFNIYAPGRRSTQSHVDRGWVTDRFAPFARTGAHELGHQILIERKDWLFSITHKGTSTISQAKLPDAPFHLEEDKDGNINWEIDIMYYYNAASSQPPDTWQARTLGAEDDVCVLVSMACVAFG